MMQQLFESGSDLRFEVPLFSFEFELHLVLLVGKELAGSRSTFEQAVVVFRGEPEEPNDLHVGVVPGDGPTAGRAVQADDVRPADAVEGFAGCVGTVEPLVHEVVDDPRVGRNATHGLHVAGVPPG